MSGVLIKRGNLEKETYIEERPCEDTQGEDKQKSKRERHGTDSPSQPSERTNPADTLILDF